MSTVALSIVIMVAVFIVVFILAAIVMKDMGEAFMLGVYACGLSLFPILMFASYREDVRPVTEEMTATIERVENKLILLEGAEKTLCLSTNEVVKEGDTIVYQISESGKVIVVKIN